MWQARLLQHYASVCTVSEGRTFTVLLASDMTAAPSKTALRRAVAAHPTWAALLGDYHKLHWTRDTSS
jgi:hypothetical protein